MAVQHVKYKEASYIHRDNNKGGKMNREPLIENGTKSKFKQKRQTLNIIRLDEDNNVTSASASPSMTSLSKADLSAPRLNTLSTTEPWVDHEDTDDVDREEQDMRAEMAQLRNILSGETMDRDPDYGQDIDRLREQMESHQKSLSNKFQM